jgi:predicted dithiol-disulfide oxidoreductase (DUF899 family)
MDGSVVHLAQRDVTLLAVSRATQTEIAAFQKRMGWNFKWVSSFGSDFNYDFHVSYTPEQITGGQVYYNYNFIPASSEELSGDSVFYRDSSGDIFHTYSTHGRGDEMFVGTYMYLDITPKGRNENGPRYNLTDWVRHHDRYEADGSVNDQGRYVAAPKKMACGCEGDE